MLVCAHGNVVEYCEEHGMRIAENWHGELTDYSGDCRVIVTSREMGLQEFLYLRMAMFSRGYDLRSVHHPNVDEKVNEFLEYAGMQERSRRREVYGGRQPFGWQRRNGEVIENPAMLAVARKIIELRDAGKTLREIQSVPEIHHPDGRRISVSTIQQIIKNRERYEK